MIQWMSVNSWLVGKLVSGWLVGGQLLVSQWLVHLVKPRLLVILLMFWRSDIESNDVLQRHW